MINKIAVKAMKLIFHVWSEINKCPENRDYLIYSKGEYKIGSIKMLSFTLKGFTLKSAILLQIISNLYTVSFCYIITVLSWLD